MPPRQAISVLVTVKAYPNLSQRHGEVVCVAGTRTDTERPEWVRLFPVPFRDLSFQSRFKKYQQITLNASRSGGDTRPESWRPDPDSIVVGPIIKSARNWRDRKPWVTPLAVESMCELQRQQRVDGTSLGVFKPVEVLGFDAESDAGEWDPAKQAIVAQPSLLFPTKAGLEKIPYRFRYHYRCADRGCNTHHQSIVDWEIAESYRSWLPKYGQEGIVDALRQKWLDTICAPDRDTYFFVGNQHQHPEAFLVLGAFWPKKEPVRGEPQRASGGPRRVLPR